MHSAKTISRAAAAVLAVTLGMASVAHADSLTVKIADGKLHGKTLNNGKVRAFEGIPYAAPPIGDLRWKAPQPVKPWTADLDATKFGPHCAQGHSSTTWFSRTTACQRGLPLSQRLRPRRHRQAEVPRHVLDSRRRLHRRRKR